MSADRSGGHVFCVARDLRRLACDAWFLPGDDTPHVSKGWLMDDVGLKETVDSLDPSRLPPNWDVGGVRVSPLRLADDRRATPVLSIIPVAGTDDPNYHRETLRQFVELAITLPRPRATSAGRSGFWRCQLSVRDIRAGSAPWTAPARRPRRLYEELACTT